MALFGRKEKDNGYDTEAQKLNTRPLSKACERIVFGEVTGEDNKALYYVDELRKNNPLVLNFESTDVSSANKVLAFISGACYVLGGKVVKMQDKIYMFALKEDFLDGSLDEWLKALKS